MGCEQADQHGGLSRSVTESETQRVEIDMKNDATRRFYICEVTLVTETNNSVWQLSCIDIDDD